MARQPNYSFEKRRKEADRQARKDAKREERDRRRREGAAEPDPTADSPAPDDSAVAPRAEPTA